MHNHLLQWLFGILACFIAGSVARKAIIGGNPAEIDHFKYKVSLQHNSRHFCGGGIIGQRLVLTAASCVVATYEYRILYRHITVLSGTNVLNKTSHSAFTGNVHKIYAPTNYHSDLTAADIAILKLFEEFPLNSPTFFLMSLELPSLKTETFEYVNAIISGFGWTWFNVDKKVGGNNNTQLYWANTVILPPNDPYYLNGRVLCATLDQNRHQNCGTCRYDTGGPLVIDGSIVIGVLSRHTPDCSERHAIARYTRVTEHKTFIENVKADKINKNIHEWNLSR